MTVLSRISSGLVWVLTATSNLVLRLFGAHTPTQEQVTEEDVRAAVAEAAESGGLEAAESRLIERVLGLTDRTARELMTPRRDIVSLNVLSPENELVQAAIDGGHARYAAHEGSLDETVGFLHTRDLLRLGREPDLTARDLIRQALYVPENADSEDVLRSFQRHGSRAAFVVDEYGSIIGLITITDVLSELVHDLADGDDATPAVTLRDDGSYLVEGDAPLHEVRERIGLPKGNEDAATMAGYVLHHLGHIPAVAETITVEGWRLEVMDMDGSRIDAVLVVPPG
jgi:putative hemolysin